MPPHVSPEEEAKLFHEGVALFNEHEWFEAHEVWEDIWHMAEGERKRFLQGLIQAAVTLEHVRRGNPRGVRTVFGTCVPKFDGLPQVYMGVDIRRLLRELEAAIRPILDLPDEWFDPARPRGQDLPFDAEQAPKIELAYDPFADSA